MHTNSQTLMNCILFSYSVISLNFFLSLVVGYNVNRLLCSDFSVTLIYTFINQQNQRISFIEHTETKKNQFKFE